MNQISQVDYKRNHFRKQIRRKTSNIYYSKRRQQLLLVQQLEECLQTHSFNIPASYAYILQDDCTTLIYPFKRILQMQPLGDLFYHITGWSICQQHPFGAMILEQMSSQYSISKQSTMVIEQHEQFNYECCDSVAPTQQELTCLEEVWRYFVEWSQKEQEKIKTIIQSLHRYRPESDLLRRQVIIWIGLLTNFILLANSIRQILIINNRSDKLKQYSTLNRRLIITHHPNTNSLPYQYQIFLLCNKTMLNLLAGDDIQLIKHLELFRCIIGRNIRLYDLYYNMFLVKGVPQELTDNMLKSYLMLLENNREEFMNQHFTFLKILYLGVFNSHFANNDNHNDKLTMSSVNLASQIIKLLNNLLRVINIQYDNQQFLLQPTTNQPDQQNPMIYLCKTLYLFSNYSTLCQQIIQMKHILRMFVIHLQTRHQIEQSAIQVIILKIIGCMTYYKHIAGMLFINQPRLWTHFSIILSHFVGTRVGSVDSVDCHERPERQENVYKASKNQIDTLRQLLHIYSNLLALQTHTNQLLTPGFISQILSLYNSHCYIVRNHPYAESVLLQCYFTIRNIFIMLKKAVQLQTDGAVILVVQILQLQGILQIVMSMLKRPVAKSSSIILSALEFVVFILDLANQYDDHSSIEYTVFYEFASEMYRFEYFDRLAQCDNKSIADRIDYVQYLLHKRCNPGSRYRLVGGRNIHQC